MGYVGKLPRIRVSVPSGAPKASAAASAAPAQDQDVVALRREVQTLRADLRAVQRALAGIRGARDGLRYRVEKLEAATDTRRDLAEERAQDRIGVALGALLQQVADVSGILPDDLISQRRQKAWVAARGVFCALARRAGYSTSTIGVFLAGRHHASVIYLSVKGQQELADNAEFWGDLNG